MHLGAATLVLGRGGCGVEAAGRMLSVGVGREFFCVLGEAVLEELDGFEH